MNGRELAPARLEAFSDGVLAIASTPLVLDLRVPAPTACPCPFVEV